MDRYKMTFLLHQSCPTLDWTGVSMPDIYSWIMREQHQRGRKKKVYFFSISDLCSSRLEVQIDVTVGFLKYQNQSKERQVECVHKSQIQKKRIKCMVTLRLQIIDYRSKSRSLYYYLFQIIFILDCFVSFCNIFL